MSKSMNCSNCSKQFSYQASDTYTEEISTDQRDVTGECRTKEIRYVNCPDCRIKCQVNERFNVLGEFL